MGLTPMKKVLALATCFNRKERTLAAIDRLTNGNPTLSFDFLLLDDNSTDGTPEAVAKFDNVRVIHGNGSCFYTGGMRILIEEAKKSDKVYDYCLMFNDDVQFYDHCIEYLVSKRDDVVWSGRPAMNRENWSTVELCAGQNGSRSINISWRKMKTACPVRH